MQIHRFATAFGRYLALLAIVVGTIIPALAQSSTTNQEETSTPIVRLIYLVPTDRPYRLDYANAMTRAGKSIQLWYLPQMARRTITLEPVVTVVHTPHPAAWYSINPYGYNAVYCFCLNAVVKELPLTSGNFFDQKHLWLFYIDSDPRCGQAFGSTSNVTLRVANDLCGLAGKPNNPTCPGDQPDPNQYNRCRWIGGLANNMGLARVLDYPSIINDYTYKSLMWFGFLKYPTRICSGKTRTSSGNPRSSAPPSQAAVTAKFGCDGKAIKPKVLGLNQMIDDGSPLGISSGTWVHTALGLHLCFPQCSRTASPGICESSTSRILHFYAEERMEGHGVAINTSFLRYASVYIGGGSCFPNKVRYLLRYADRRYLGGSPQRNDRYKQPSVCA